MEMKFYWNNNGHMSKMVAILVYGKILKNPLPQNQRNDYKDTWYVASGTPFHQSLFKLWPLVDLDLFLARSKFGT